MPDLVAVDLSKLTAEDFMSLSGSVFVVSLPNGQTVTFRLDSVTTLGRPLPTRTAFSLLFTGPKAPLLRQSIYRLEHEQMGILDIFIVPIRETADQRLYEAVFT